MKLWGLMWAIASMLSFQASDITLRLASVETHYAVGTILQATPLMVITIALANKRLIFRDKSISLYDWVLGASYGGLQFFMGNAMFYLAIQLGGLTISTPSVQSQAIWAILLGGLFLKERINRMMIMGIVVFIIGIVGLSWFKSLETELASGWIWAVFFGLLGGLSWASASAVERTLLKKRVPMSFILAVGSITGILMLNIIVFSYYGIEIWKSVEPVAGLQVLLAGCFNGLAIWSFTQAIRLVEISKVVPVISLNIVFNTINGALWFDEYINAGVVISMLIIFMGVLVVQTPSNIWSVMYRKKNDYVSDDQQRYRGA